MPATLPIGPYRTLNLPEGGTFPYYIIPYDKEGFCEGPKTLEHLLNHCSEYSDIFLFSHGWNNDWSVATGRYESFINGYQELRKKLKLPVPNNYKPLLVGIFWPSQALAWFESETGPDIAAASPEKQDKASDEMSRTLRDIAANLPADQKERFYELFQSETLDKKEAEELAQMLAHLTEPDSEDGVARKAEAADLLGAAAALSTPEPDLEEIGTAGTAGGTPQAAGWGDFLGKLDPRNLIKPFTVWQMKDRAGKVGSGVANLLQELLKRSATQDPSIKPGTRIHLIGHSFGCKVVMTALSRMKKPVRKVESALLLQPAVSQYCFASKGKVPDREVAGGFHNVLERVERPILSTYSAHDNALTKMFHLAVRRHDDLGELQPSAAGETPSRYGALGGFGPQPDFPSLQILDPVNKYTLNNGSKVIGINGSRTISGHGDISNESTWWALYVLATAHMS